MHLHSRHIASLATSLALVCSLSIAACAQRETTTAEDYAAGEPTEQTEEATQQVDEQANEEEAAETETTETSEATAEKQADEEKPPLLNTEILMSSISISDKVVNGEVEVDEEALSAIPEYEGEEYEAIEVSEPSVIDDIAATKANADGVLWYTSGFAIVTPDHWVASVGSDEIDFRSTKYDLVAFMASWDKASCNVSALDATDYYLANLSDGGFYNFQYLDRGIITIGGAERGSYAQVLADFDWKGETGTVVIDINFFEGKTKLNGLSFMTPASSYSAAQADIDAVWNSICYVSGEEF